MKKVDKRSRSAPMRSVETLTSKQRSTQRPAVKVNAVFRTAGRIERDDVIEVVASNPHRIGTDIHRNYRRYRTGLTVGEFQSGGGNRKMLWWDWKCGRLRLRPIDGRATDRNAQRLAA